MRDCAIRQETGSCFAQTGGPHAVVNHLPFCMAVAAISWIYGAHLDHAPACGYASENTRELAFAYARRWLAGHRA